MGKMMTLDQARRDYREDPMFRRVVDTIAQWILEMHVTPAEARTAAMLAAMHVEETRVHPHINMDRRIW
jgi:hypothetical protein